MEKPLSRKNGSYIKYYCAKCSSFLGDNETKCKNCGGRELKGLTFFEDKEIKSALEYFTLYSDSARSIFKRKFQSKYNEYLALGKKEGWDTKEGESWNYWLLEQSFPELMNPRTDDKQLSEVSGDSSQD